MSNKLLSRRQFLNKTGAYTVASSMSLLWMSNVMAAQPQPKKRRIAASDKVNVAAIGIGNRGKEVMRHIGDSGHCNFVALCDVDMGAKQTLEMINNYPDIPRYQDFRVMFDEMASQIDAVCIATPDFSHFPAAMLAMSLGKHVYVEKPLAHTFNECQLLMDAAEKYGVVTQMGNQGHSGANYFQFKAWVEAGIIKDVTAITAHMNGARRWHGWDINITRYPDAEPVPSTMDWDVWLGTEKFLDYNHDLVNGQWRCWFDLGMGALGDWGAHIMDTAHEFLKLGLPTQVNMLNAPGHNDFFYPTSSTIEFKFPERAGMPACDITWYDGVDNLPPIPEGYGDGVEIDPNIPSVNGVVKPTKLGAGKIIYSKDLMFKGGSHSATLSIIPESKAKEMESKLPNVPESPSDHYTNFLLACKGQERARSPFSVSGPLSQVFCLGTIAQRLNANLEFDTVKHKITNNKLANSLLVGPKPRKEWAEFYKL